MEVADAILYLADQASLENGACLGCKWRPFDDVTGLYDFAAIQAAIRGITA